MDQIAKGHSHQVRCDTTIWLNVQQIRKTVFRFRFFNSTEGKKETKPSVLGTGHYLLVGGRRATKLRKSLAKKLWPTPIKGLKEIDPPKAQIKKL